VGTINLKGKTLKLYITVPRIFFISFVSIIIFIQVTKPFLTPITDDWLFYPWQTRQTHPGNFSDFELFVGQQQILMKYTLYITSFVPFFHAPYSGLVNLIFGATGIALIIKSQIKFHGGKLPLLLAPALITIAFSFKPLYMFFMATSLGSMIFLFLIGMYFKIKNSNRSNSLKLLPIIFVAPFAFGAGFVIIMCELAEQSYKFIFYKNRKVNLKKSIPIFVTCVLSIYFSYIRPNHLSNFNNLAGGAPTSTSLGLINAVQDPLYSAKFILISIGNIFVPSSRYDPHLPLACGILFILFIIFFSFKTPLSMYVSGILENKSCVMAGMFFIFLTLVARGDRINQSYIPAVAPRYITGSFIFTLGVLILISKNLKKELKKNIFHFMLIIITSTVFISGFKTGLEWHSVRMKQTLDLYNCIQVSQPKDLEIGGKCFKLGEVIKNPVSSTIFESQLKNFSKYGY